MTVPPFFAVISSGCEKSFPVMQFKTLELNHYLGLAGGDARANRE
jgi:hypothetical protein